MWCLPGASNNRGICQTILMPKKQLCELLAEVDKREDVEGQGRRQDGCASKRRGMQNFLPRFEVTR